MPVYEPPLDPGGGDGLDDEAASGGAAQRPDAAPENAPPPWLMLTRGRQRMVLFRGWRAAGVIEAFQGRRMAICLALSADDFSRRCRIGGCDYVFIGGADLSYHRTATFAAALHDLARANWSIDLEVSRPVQDTSWAVIAGGYQPRASAERRRPKSEQPSPAQQDLPDQRELQRVEA